LERLLACPHLGKDMRLCDIHDNEVTNLVAWRRGHRRRGRKDAPLISNATVNRSTTEVLQKIFTRAKTKWSARFDDEPDWKEHMLDEPKARGRELRQGERAALLDEAIRNDYADYYEFVHAVGQRAYKECLIEWSNVHWPEREIEVEGKQGRTITYPITETVAAILRQQIGKHPKWVFTYVAARNDRRKGLVKGQRYPITKSGAKTRWKRDRKKAAAVCPSVANLRTHSSSRCCDQGHAQVRHQSRSGDAEPCQHQHHLGVLRTRRERRKARRI
jgi:integrase-like protein